MLHTAGDDEDELPLEINDYSQATAFERCVGRLEALFRKWQRGEDVNSNGEGEGEIECKGTAYQVYLKKRCAGSSQKSDHHVRVMEDLMCSSFDFTEPVGIDTTDSEMIPLYFGVQEFIQIVPVRSSASHEEILSAASLAVSSLQVPIPVLVPSKTAHQGLANTRNCTVRFATEIVRSPPEHCSTLEGILDTFYLNIGLRTSLEGEGMHVATRFRYIQPGYRLSEWYNVMSPEHSPFMSDTDPVKRIFTELIWPDTIETGLIDNRVWSTFNLQDPPVVKMRVLQKDRHDKTYRITESIRALVDILSDLEHNMDSESDEGRPYISRALRSSSFHPPWAHSKSAGESLVGNLAGFDPDLRMTLERETKQKCQFIVDKAFSPQPLTEKGSEAIRSVLDKLAFLAAGSLSTVPEFKILQKLFAEKVIECWKSLTEVNGVSGDGKIDWGAPMLTQKIELLNFCITAVTQADGYHTPDEDEVDVGFQIPQNLQLRTNGCRGDDQSYELSDLPPDVITSDMMSFKHANVNTIHDNNSDDAFNFFLKWWSPDRDLSSSPQIKMLWDAAQPMAAFDQPKLLDFTNVAKRTLRWIEEMDLDVWVHTLVHHAIVSGAKIMKGSVYGNRLSYISGEIENFGKEFRQECNEGYKTTRPKLNYEAILENFEGIEELLCLAASLLDRYHLPVSKAEDSVKVIHVVNRLLASQDFLQISPSDWEIISLATLPANPNGTLDNIREPDSREFIIRCIGDRPAVAPTSLGMYQNRDPSIEPCTHRMYVSMKEGEFRLCTALSENLY
eukprot:TRINITY_DN7568_c0_g1_i2.p1 TRINITY_DN7568_c0_g1~~TRINITY_DN7568_c0_g1_i2.p1  ORF type:complete len:804 (+),score=121.36 TRINITY_DN7568_c0_g1_i2:52-2412(+)